MDVYRRQIEVNKVDNEDEKIDEGQDSNDVPEVSLKVKLARLYYFIFLSRRLIITFLVVLIPSSVFALKAMFLLLLQIAYLAYAI